MITIKKISLNDEAKHFSDIFKKGSDSIDLFLSINTDFSEIGKKAITLMILTAEKDSRLREDIEDEDKKKQDWYSLLFQRMRRGLSSPDSYKRFAENKVSFINFNYDRSLEHFLYESLINLYYSQHLEDNINDTILEVQNLGVHERNSLIPFPFFHVYGKIAEIEWKKDGLKYGKDFDYQQINELKNNIDIIHYDKNEQDFSEIRKTIKRAKRIFFLGFGFARENMDILGIPHVFKHEPEIYGTALGWTEKELIEIRGYLRSSFMIQDPRYNNPYIKNLNCIIY